MKRPGLEFDIRPAVLWLGLFLLAGGIQVGGGRFQPARIVLGLAFLATILVYGKLRNTDTPIIRHFLMLGCIWIMWGAVTLFWCFDPINGAREVTGIAIGVITAMGVVSLTDGSSHLKALRMGWVWAALVTMPIAAWELATGDHLSLAAQKGSEIAGGADVGLVRYAAVTFGNHNGYVAFLLLTYPAVLWWYDRSKIGMKMIASVLIIAVAGLVLISGSRLGLIVMLMDTFLWLIFARPGRFKIPLGALVTAILLGVAAVVAVMNTSFTESRILSLLSGHDASLGTRTAQTYNALILTSNSYGMGIGAGGFDSAIIRGYGLYKTYDGIILITSAHNVMLEILANYGVLVFLMFVLFFLHCGRCLWRGFRLARKRGDYETEESCVAGLVWLTPFPLILAINSSILTFSMMWAAIGTICVLAHLSSRYIREGSATPAYRARGIS